MGDIPDYLDESFDKLNAQWFEGRLPRPQWIRMKGVKASHLFIGPGKHMVGFDPGLKLMPRPFVEDSLLHEMVHVALSEWNGDNDQKHVERFTELANAIGSGLGLPAVLPGSDAALDWPQSVRPKDYFPGDMPKWGSAG